MNIFKKLFGKNKIEEHEEKLTRKPVDENIAPKQYVHVDKTARIPRDAEKIDLDENEPIDAELIRNEPQKEPVKAEEKFDEYKEPDYIVSKNKSKKSQYYEKWGVKKDGSTKTIKYFDAKAEALKYANELAESSGSKVVSV